MSKKSKDITLNFNLKQNESLKEITKSIELYKQTSNLSGLTSLADSYSKIFNLKMPDFNQPFIDALSSYTRMKIPNLTSDLLALPMQDSLYGLADTINEFVRFNSLEGMNTLFESMNTLMSSFSLDQIVQLQKINYSKIFIETLPKISSLEEMINLTYEKVQNELKVDTFQNEEINIEEMQEVFQEQATNPIGAQERIANWVEKFGKQNYILVIVMTIILNGVLNIFLYPYLSNKIGIPVMTKIDSYLKDSPEKDAEKIYQIKEGVELFISEDINYYYKVYFEDENGELREGYVAKRNLKKVELINETQDDNEENESDNY